MIEKEKATLAIFILIVSICPIKDSGKSFHLVNSAFI